MSINWNKRLDTIRHYKAEYEHWIKHYADCQKSHDDFLKLREKMLYNDEIKKFPQYIRSELQGYFDALYKIYVLNNLIFVYKWTNEKWYTTKQLEKLFPDFTHERLYDMVKDAENKGNTISSFAWDNYHLF